MNLTESLISTKTSFFTFYWFLPFNIGALKMFFVSGTKCVCVCVCVGERGYQDAEARCIFRAREELAEMENKAFKFICLCFRRDVKEQLSGGLCVLFNI